MLEVAGKNLEKTRFFKGGLQQLGFDEKILHEKYLRGFEIGMKKGQLLAVKEMIDQFSNILFPGKGRKLEGAIEQLAQVEKNRFIH